jgi:hypothetical protein
MAHGSWPHATAMVHSGCKAAACRRGVPATVVCNRRGPRWLDLKNTVATAAAVATAIGCQN